MLHSYCKQVVVGIFESTVDQDRESDPKSLKNFLMHFLIYILTLNAYYSLQKKTYSITRLL
jgi:hypothetical protein